MARHPRAPCSSSTSRCGAAGAVGTGVWHLRRADDPWPRPGVGGSGPALRGVAPWLALVVVGAGLGRPRHRHRAAPVPPDDQRAGPGLPSAERRPSSWSGCSSGSATRPPASGHPSTAPDRPVTDATRTVRSTGARSPRPWDHGSTTARPRLLLPQSPPVGVAFWVAVPVVAVLIDVAARRSHGRAATAEEFVRFISTARLANLALDRGVGLRRLPPLCPLTSVDVRMARTSGRADHPSGQGAVTSASRRASVNSMSRRVFFE